MKRSHLFTSFVAVLAAAGSSAGCATIIKGGDAWSQVQFRNTPALQGDQALQIWVDGKPTPWKLEFSKVTGGGSNEKVVSEPTVDLSTKSTHDVRVRVGGCEAEFQVRPSISGWWIVLDLTVGLGIGVVVDWMTGAWADFGDDMVHYTPSLMAKKGKPVPGMTPVLPCGTATAARAPKVARRK